ncbi:hypothetical protein TR80_014275 [Xanthomonas campestris]|uniref:hypothetical protein n=1 Tax=Xanthomonas campestris TaxID=339 RepID=UPI000CDB9563|nr:hypothetical protein [Xanthomonas campestris]TXD42395.1 hypothetical protein TR80_014275 [Xanthomonas campestris]
MAMYFADNKDIRDLLDTSRQKLTPEVLREFLLRRGIIVSDEATKADLFDQISMWTLDLDDLNWLLDKTARADRTERYTSATVLGKFSVEEVRKAVEVLKKGSIGPQLDSLTFTKSAGGPFLLAATYSELDPAKTRLRQKRIRDGSVRLEIGPQGVSVRHEANERMSAVADELIKAMTADKAGAAQSRKIELSHLPSAESRTTFFLTLIGAVSGMKLSDVSKVQVERSPPSLSLDSAAIGMDPGDEDGVNDDEGSGDGVEDEDEDEVNGADLDLVGNQVRGAILRGVSLLTSPEFQMLKKHFFLYGMEWTGEEESEKGKIVQFEAAFENPQACTGFRYKVKGIIDRKKTGDGEEFVKTSRSCTDIENSHYMKLLEEASRDALAVVDPNSSKLPSKEEGDSKAVGSGGTSTKSISQEASAPSDLAETDDEVKQDD